MAIFGMNFGVWAPLLARDALDIGASGFGLLMSSLGLGSLAGALTLAFTGRRPSPRVMLGTALLFGAFEIALGLVAGLGLTAVLAMVLMAGTGFAHEHDDGLGEYHRPDELTGLAAWSRDEYLPDRLRRFDADRRGAAGFLSGLWGAPVAVAVGGAVVIIVALAIGGRFTRIERGGEDQPVPG